MSPVFPMLYFAAALWSLGSVAVGRPWVRRPASRTAPAEIRSMQVFDDMARLLTLAWAGLFATAGIASLFVTVPVRLGIGVVLAALGLASPKVGEWYIRRRLTSGQSSMEHV
ncbi:MAG: hypothetical protein R8G01_23135 [Ilumatobacteraceae bacterium]|nr:hypothetical protein [Ilumatobacteraceae bacterium]